MSILAGSFQCTVNGEPLTEDPYGSFGECVESSFSANGMNFILQQAPIPAGELLPFGRSKLNGLEVDLRKNPSEEQTQKLLARLFQSHETEK